jgi:hypothetical protein
MADSGINFAERVRQTIRLEILRCLASAPDYTTTDGPLHAHLVACGLSCSHAALRTLLAGLDDQGLVVGQRAGGENGVWMATLTEAGEDVAAGRSRVPGIARPGPGS